jgi:hypothetical protein
MRSSSSSWAMTMLKLRTDCRMLRCESMAPLGLPVVPEV